MNRIDLQEYENGWAYQEYDYHGKFVSNGYIEKDKNKTTLENLELIKDKIETIVYGIFDWGQIIFLQKNEAPTN